MSATAKPTVVIGGGVNGLVCATLLARAGRTVTLLEQRADVGGAAVTRELAPGFHVPAAAHDVGPLRADVAHELNLAAHGLEFVPREAWMTALDGRGHAVTLWHDAAKTAAALGAFSTADAGRWPAFMAARAKLGRVVASILRNTPPSIDDPSPRELWRLLQTARQFRRLGRSDGYRLLRWGPMPVADLVQEHVLAHSEETQAGEHGVRAPRELVEHPRSIVAVGRLSVDPVVKDDSRVDTERDAPLLVHRSGLALGMRAHELSRVGVRRVVLDVRGLDDVELDRELLEDHPPLGRGRGERQYVLRAAHISSDGQFRAHSAVTDE